MNAHHIVHPFLSSRTQVVAIVASVVLLLFVLHLVRRKKMAVEYSVLWLVISLGMLVLSIWFGLLEDLTVLIGAVVPSSTLFFFALLVVSMLLMHFSIRVSALERKLTTLTQEVGLASLDRASTANSEPDERSLAGDDESSYTLSACAQSTSD